MQTVGIEGYLFIKKEVVGEDEDLLDIAPSGLHLCVQPFAESADDYEDVIVQACDRVIKDSNAIHSHTGLCVTPFQKMKKVEEGK